MASESPVRKDYAQEWSTPQEKAKSQWLFTQEPQRALDMIETMDLSRLAFK
jgi:hypothetical protein